MLEPIEAPVSGLRIKRGYKTELDPNQAQREAFVRHAGVARWAYNWGLHRKMDVFREVGMAPNAIHLHKEICRLKRTTHPWLAEVSKCAPQEALRDLDRAIRAFGTRRRRGQKVGFPRFRSKKRGVGTFRFSGAVSVQESRVRLPRIGWVKLKERGYLPRANVHVLSTTVSERAGRWFISLQVEQEIEVPSNSGGPVGLDLGVSHLATASNGLTLSNPRPLSRYIRRLRRCQRAMYRKDAESRNRAKAIGRLARLHRRIVNIRQDNLHKFTTLLTKTKSEVVVEDLNIAGMLRNRHLARAIADASLGELRRQLGYKAPWYGSVVTVAPAFFPSSRQCSCDGCGAYLPLELSQRVYSCSRCGCSRDRDLNAALNLARLAVSSTDTENACGGDVRPAHCRLAPLKQESASPRNGPSSMEARGET